MESPLLVKKRTYCPFETQQGKKKRKSRLSHTSQQTLSYNILTNVNFVSFKNSVTSVMKCDNGLNKPFLTSHLSRKITVIRSLY